MQFGENQIFSKQQTYKTFLTWINDLIIQFFGSAEQFESCTLVSQMDSVILYSSFQCWLKGGSNLYIYADTVPLNKMLFAHIYHSINSNFYCVGICLRLPK